MNQIEFLWKIESKDDRAGTMVVEYTRADGTDAHRYNIPQPQAGSNVHDHLALYAPITQWAAAVGEFEPLEAGSSGSGVVRHQLDDDSESPNVTGDWSEEYLRAMIYQVLEEIKESQV